jgi:DNA-binding transcriptional MerR regulator
MSGQDLFLEMRDLQNELNATLGEFGKWGRNYAKADYDYRLERRKAFLVGREKGIPVTILDKVCEGEEKVAKMRLNMNTAETLYKLAGEKIQALKLQIRTIESQMDREFHSA